MGRQKNPKPLKSNKVMTPGSYSIEQKKKSGGPKVTPKKGRPKVRKSFKGTTRKDNYR